MAAGCHLGWKFNEVQFGRMILYEEEYIGKRDASSSVPFVDILA
jgi:hypothetical protein